MNMLEMLTPKGLHGFQNLLEKVEAEADKTIVSVKTNGVVLQKIKKQHKQPD